MKLREKFNDKELSRSLWTYIILFALALIFTVCIAVIDRRPVGPDGSWVGFATINAAFHEKFGYCGWLHRLTEYAGYIPALTACFYAALGVYQLVTRKKLEKVDPALIILAGFYVLVGLVYFGFELLCINCRPVILDKLEASYPSSHTFLTIALCGSTLLLNKLVYQKASWARLMNLLAILFLILVPIGRLFSGVHWLTDILGGYLIGAALVALLNLVIRSNLKPAEKKKAAKSSS